MCAMRSFQMMENHSLRFEHQKTLSSLISAVEIVMNANASQSDRSASLNVCEEFRETSKFCLDCGFILSDKEYLPIVRHFGLQLVEHFIKYRWAELQEDEIHALRLKTLKLLDQGTYHLLLEEAYMKDAVSRILVELLKRIWPQLWPDMFQTLYDICQHGLTQTELVLKMFLRLVEDLVAFQTVPGGHRQSLLQSLTSIMNKIFPFIVTVLDENRRHSGKLLSVEAKQEVTAVARTALVTLAGFVDWINMQHITDDDSHLLRILCQELGNPELGLYAAECLLLIVSRKGKIESRIPMLALFSPLAITSILESAQIVAAQDLREGVRYLFLKRLCQLLTEMGKQLCFLWGQDQKIARPQEFDAYLKALMKFLWHPSILLRRFIFPLWTQFLRHESISEDPIFQSLLPQLVEACAVAMTKAGIPSMDDCVSCQFSRIDFESDEDFSAFYSKYRNDVMETLRVLTMLAPTLAFDAAVGWVWRQFQKPDSAHSTMCNTLSPVYLEWESMSAFLESVMLRFFQSEKPLPDFCAGIELLKRISTFQSQDPLIRSCILSCMRALIPFIKYDSKVLPSVLEAIFSSVTFNLPGQTKSTRSRFVMSVRQHACSILVKTCKEYAHLIFPHLDHLYSCLKTIDSDPEELSQLERCILTEALIIVSNESANYERQSAFIGEMLAPLKMWTSSEFAEAFSHPVKFMSYVGLDHEPVLQGSDDVCGINRSHLMLCINITSGCLTRCSWPSDAEVAENGGFMLRRMSNGTIVFRNPCATHVFPFLNSLFWLMKTLCCLWLPEFLRSRHFEFSKAYDLPQHERCAVFGIQPPKVDHADSFVQKQPSEGMQNFMLNIFSNCCLALGLAGQCLRHEFYSCGSLGQAVVNILSSVNYLPDYRLKALIHFFLKPYVVNCPKEYYESAVIPVLCSLCPFMIERLSSEWLQIHQRCDERTDDMEDDVEQSHEVLDDILTRQLSREYLDFIGTSCFYQQSDPPNVGEELVMEAVDAPKQAIVGGMGRKLNELGALCMASEELVPSIFLFVLRSLSWNDTQTSWRSALISLTLVRQLVAGGSVLDEGAIHIMQCILGGLHVHGRHDGLRNDLISLAVSVYEEMHARYPGVRHLLASVPDCSLDKVTNFEKTYLQRLPRDLASSSANHKLPSEKKKKEAFRSLISSIIGKDTGKMFKREVNYTKLPTMFLKRAKPEKRPDTDCTQDKIGLHSLFIPEDI